MEAGEGSSGGEDKTERKYPLGFRFKPSPDELMEFYLLPKLQGKPSVPNDAIIEADVYECHPGTLIDQRYKDKGVDNVWYFLSPRTRKYPHGVGPSRRTADDLGRWKPDDLGRWKTSSGKEKKDPEAAASETRLCNNGTIKYCVTSLAYHEGPPRNEKKTKWLMHEYTVPEYEIKAGSLQGGDMMLDKCALYVIYISNLHPAPESGQETSAAGVGAASTDAKGKGAMLTDDELDVFTGMIAAVKNVADAIRESKLEDVHPQLYESVMFMPGFTEDALLVAYSHLLDNKNDGARYMKMSENHRVMWLRNFLAKHYE